MGYFLKLCADLPIDNRRKNNPTNANHGKDEKYHENCERSFRTVWTIEKFPHEKPST
jgi:hypothetical protein